MNANLPISPEDMMKWTPNQQIETLSQIARIVMAQQSTLTLSISCRLESEPDSKTFLLTELPIAIVSVFSPLAEDRDIQNLNRLAADPRNRIAMTDDTLNQILD